MIYYVEKLLNNFCEKLFMFMITNPGYISDKLVTKESLWSLLDSIPPTLKLAHQGEYEDLCLKIFQKLSKQILTTEFLPLLTWTPQSPKTFFSDPSNSNSNSTNLTISYESEKKLNQNFGILLSLLKLDPANPEFSISTLQTLSKILGETIYPFLHQIFTSEIFTCPFTQPQPQNKKNFPTEADQKNFQNLLTQKKIFFFKVFAFLKNFGSEIFKISSFANFHFFSEKKNFLEKFEKIFFEICADLQSQKEFFGGKFLGFCGEILASEAPKKFLQEFVGEILGWGNGVEIEILKEVVMVRKGMGVGERASENF